MLTLKTQQKNSPDDVVNEGVNEGAMDLKITLKLSLQKNIQFSDDMHNLRGTYPYFPCFQFNI